MLKITLFGDELYDESTEEFSSVGDVVVFLEHSLVSLSKWESEFGHPFLGPTEKTAEEIFGYIQAMVISHDDVSGLVERFTESDIEAVNAYINSSQSATTFREEKGRPGSREIISSELIYYWMVTYSIPFECETWHLNRLFTLIRICNVKNSKQKKMSKREVADRNRALNEQRKAALGTTG